MKIFDRLIVALAVIWCGGFVIVWGRVLWCVLLVVAWAEPGFYPYLICK